jgi:hypothetical protein
MRGDSGRKEEGHKKEVIDSKGFTTIDVRKLKALMEKKSLTNGALSSISGVSKREIEELTSPKNLSKKGPLRRVHQSTFTLLARPLHCSDRELKPDEALPPERWNTWRLRDPHPEFHGREDLIRQLDEAWETPGCNLVVVTGGWGEGKSELVLHWLAKKKADSFRGAAAVIGWPSPGQGLTSEGDDACAAGHGGDFIHVTLAWLDSVFPAERSPPSGPASTKGEQLASTVRARRTLLVLDGLEPLLYPPGHEWEGEIRDRDVRAFVHTLAQGQPGLCIITSRLKVADLPYDGKAVRWIDVKPLSVAEGGELFLALGVKKDEEVPVAVKELKGKALLVRLVGVELAKYHKGDIRQRRKVRVALHEDAKFGGILAGLEQRLDPAERAILRLLGLFDEGADYASLDALRRAPAVPGLNDALQGLSDRRWRVAVGNLREMQLLAEEGGQPGKLELLHAEMRAYYARQFERENRKAWQEGHERLYRHLAAQQQGTPISFAGYDTLYRAVGHACKADLPGLHREAFLDLIWKRMNNEFAMESLASGPGAGRMEEFALGNFFADPDHIRARNIVRQIDDGPTKARLLFWAGATLFVLGRMEEGAPVLEAALAGFREESEFSKIIVLGWLAATKAARGDFPGALQRADELHALVGPPLPETREMRKMALNVKANVLVEKGEFDAAGRLYDEAKAIEVDLQKSAWAGIHLIQGLQRCELLVETGRVNEVEAELCGIPRVGAVGSLAHTYVRGCASLRQSLWTEAEKHLDGAARALEEHWMRIYAVLVGLARARLGIALKRWTASEEELKAAERRAADYGLVLRQIDCHLAYARLYLERRWRVKARGRLEEARALIASTGYGRRNEEVLALGKALG